MNAVRAAGRRESGAAVAAYVVSAPPVMLMTVQPLIRATANYRPILTSNPRPSANKPQFLIFELLNFVPAPKQHSVRNMLKRADIDIA
jgi:hypothetical protein